MSNTLEKILLRRERENAVAAKRCGTPPEQAKIPGGSINEEQIDSLALKILALDNLEAFSRRAHGQELVVGDNEKYCEAKEKARKTLAEVRQVQALLTSSFQRPQKKSSSMGVAVVKATPELKQQESNLRVDREKSLIAIIANENFLIRMALENPTEFQAFFESLKDIKKLEETVQGLENDIYAFFDKCSKTEHGHIISKPKDIADLLIEYFSYPQDSPDKAPLKKALFDIFENQSYTDQRGVVYRNVNKLKKFIRRPKLITREEIIRTIEEFEKKFETALETSESAIQRASQGLGALYKKSEEFRKRVAVSFQNVVHQEPSLVDLEKIRELLSPEKKEKLSQAFIKFMGKSGKSKDKSPLQAAKDAYKALIPEKREDKIEEFLAMPETKKDFLPHSYSLVTPLIKQILTKYIDEEFKK